MNRFEYIFILLTKTPNGEMVFDTSREKTLDNVSLSVYDKGFFYKTIEEKKLFISHALSSRLPNHPIIFVVAKPIYNKNGDLLAVIHIGMQSSNLTGFYSIMKFGFEPTVSIFKSDGHFVSTNHGIDKYLESNNSSNILFTKYVRESPFGNYRSKSIIDGERRLASYNFIPDLDMVIFAEIENSVAFERWKIRSIRISVIVTALLAFSLFTFYFVYRTILQREALQLKNDRLDELNNIDELTGIGNRRNFETTLKKDWNRYLRYKLDMSVLLIDIDYFKPYNDNYGHPEGDKTIHKVAQALQECVHRPTDLVARYGGEEFVVILNCDEAGAIIVAESICAKIESLNIKHEFSQISDCVTVSVGVTSTSNNIPQSPEDLIQEADVALYRAKHNGKNQVVPFRKDML